MRHLRPGTFVLLLLFFCCLPTAQAESTLEQIMADPDWIGPAVETPFWGLDGKHVYFQLKRAGSPIRDFHGIDLGSGTQQPVAAGALADLDAVNPVYDSPRRRALFVRNGDIFLRDLNNGTLTQITRSEAVEANPQFQSNGRQIAFQNGTDWFVYDLDTHVLGPAANLKLEQDPAAAPTEADYLRDQQLRLLATLKRAKDERDRAREHDEANRAADRTRAPKPIYLGDKLTVSASALSPNGRWLLLAAQPKEATPIQTKMPKYVTESGYNEVEDVRATVGHGVPVSQSLWRVDLAEGRAQEIAFDALPGIADDPLTELRRKAGKEPLKGNRPLQVKGIQFSADGEHAAVMLHAIDNKDRWIATLTRTDQKPRPQHRLTDPAWVNYNFNEFGWLPDNKTLWFLSEQSGSAHFYTQTLDGRPKQRTRGKWEVSAPQVSADGNTVFFVCNSSSPDDYELCALDLKNDRLRELTALDGVEGFALSPQGDRVLVAYSGSYLPMQLALVPAAGGDARLLTDTRTAAFKGIDWLPPQFVEIPSKHGATSLPAKFYGPKMREPGRRYPIVMFVHGAGYTQNVHRKYPYYFREQMFHNLLVEHGYLVLDIDYRGSAGYGRDWRTAIYRQMGHPELEDYLDGLDWLVERQQGDRDRAGIYGGSYGGFMTFMALFRAPEAFKAGAALRPVTDWAAYEHEYTSNILNTPELDPEAYQKSSPIEYADRLRGYLLIAHGMLDDNVFYQDSVRLVQRLIELKKENWELASYPMERHGFVYPESWLDEYRRVFELFESTLK